MFVDFRDSFRVAGHRRGSNAVKCEMPALFDSRWPLVPVCVSDLPSGSDSSATGYKFSAEIAERQIVEKTDKTLLLRFN